MNSSPKISIVTPSFNQGDYIEKTIESILSQEYPNYEHLIIDGGSTDGTLDIIEKYANRLAYWVSEPDGGQIDAIQKGFSHATGDFLMWVNSDDYLLPGALSKLVEAHNRHPGADLVTGLGGRVDPKGTITTLEPPIGDVDLEFLLNWMTGPWFTQPSTMFSRNAWEICGPFDNNFQLAFDLDFWLRTNKAGFSFAVVNDHLSMEIHHPKQKTAVFLRHTRLEIAIVVTRHGGHEKVRKYLDEMVDKIERYEGSRLCSRFFRVSRKMEKVKRAVFNRGVFLSRKGVGT